MEPSNLNSRAELVATVAKKEGYCLAKAAYPLDFIQAVESQLGSDPLGCIAQCRNHPTTIAVATALVGPQFASVEEDSVNFTPDPAKLYRKLHNDAPPYLQPDGTLLPMWRFAVYFRDYSAYSGGLMIVPGSHLGGTSGALASLPSQPGDLVIWNFRTFHAAGAKVNGTPDAYPRNAIFFDVVPLGAERDRLLEWRRIARPDKHLKHLKKRYDTA